MRWQKAVNALREDGTLLQSPADIGALLKYVQQDILAEERAYIMEQLFNILDALTIRGVSASRIQRTKLMILPLFITSLRRTRTMGLACEARGFGANKWDSFYQELRLGLSDRVVMVAVAVLAVFFIYLRYGLGFGVAGV